MIKYTEFAVEKTCELLAIDSPTGFTSGAVRYVKDEFEALGFSVTVTEKGGVLVDLGGKEDSLGGLLLEAHLDTLGGMVAELKGNGRLRITNLGGMRAENAECENVRVYTRGGNVYEGTLQLINPSVHVNGQYADTKRTFDTTEIVLDEDTSTVEDLKNLGLEVGDLFIIYFFFKFAIT